MGKEIRITSSLGNSAKGHVVYWAYVDGQMLRKSNGVGRTFRTEAAARKAAEKASQNLVENGHPFIKSITWHPAA